MTDHSTFSYPKEKLNILLLENVSPGAVQIYREAGYTGITHLKSALSEVELIAAVRDVHVLGIRSKTQVSEAVLSAGTRLLSVGCFCIGTNQVAKAAADLHGIPVFNSPYSNTRSVAELVIGAAIMLIRRIPDKNRAAHEGRWVKDATGSRELRGKTIGIIGYGNIGSQVSVLAESLGMRVVFYDIARKLPLGNAIALSSAADVLATADLVTIHVPATPETVNMVDAALLAHCRQGMLFINYARGEVVDIEALAEAVQGGQLGGVAVDVYPEEPEANGAPFKTPLQGLPNVLLTPHIGGSTEEAQAAIGEDVSSKIISFIETGNTQGSHSVPQLLLAHQEGTHRILHMHHNVPGVLSAINTALSARNINILGQYLKTNDRTGYVVLDIDKSLSAEAVVLLREIPETIKVRMVY